MNEVSAMSLFNFFRKGLSADAINDCLCLRPTSSSIAFKAKEGMIKIYSAVANYLLHTCATDDVFAETDAALTRFTQPTTMLLTQHSEALVK